MPTTLVGVIFFVVLLVPGLVHYSTRRAHVPAESKLSPFVETSQIVTVSLGVNTITLLAFGLLRLSRWGREHSPHVSELLKNPSKYAFTGADDRLAYLVLWWAALITVSCLLAYLLARRRGPFGVVARYLAPTITVSSAWYHAFDQMVPAGGRVYVGCALRDGSYVSGYLAWFSTDTEETGDRDLILGPPFAVQVAGKKQNLGDVERVVLSARDVGRIDVSYVGK